VADWAPYRFGHWTWISGFGYAWVDDAPWGYAPSHYGRWVYVGNRWGWCPGHYVARPVWAPALVGWYGGSGWSVSVNVGAPVYGWVPLAWGEPYHPWWRRCSNACWHRYNRPYAVNVVERPHRPPSTYVNVRAITAVAGTTLAAAKPVAVNRIPIQAGSPPPTLTAAPPIRPLPVAAPAVRAGSGGAPAPASTFYQAKPRMTPTPAYSAPARNAATPSAPTRTAPVTTAPSVAVPAAPAAPAARVVEPRQRQVPQGATAAPAAPQVEPKPRHATRQEGAPASTPAAPARAVAPPPAPPPPAPRAVAPAAPPAPRAVAPAAPPAPSPSASPQGGTRGQGQGHPGASPHGEKPNANPRGGPQDAPAR
jgi:hypothetical protein